MPRPPGGKSALWRPRRANFRVTTRRPAPDPEKTPRAESHSADPAPPPAVPAEAVAKRLFAILGSHATAGHAFFAGLWHAPCLCRLGAAGPRQRPQRTD